jgi:hypothetical protein
MPEALTDTPRILNKLVDPMVGASSAGTLSFLYQGEGWEIIDSNASSESMFRWRGYIDLGGLEREALTFFLQSAQVTESLSFYGLGSSIHVTDVFSKVEITDDDLNLPTFTTGVPYAPGYNDSVQDMEQILWGRIRGFFHDSGWTSDNLQQQYFQQIWGEGIGTSASRIHLTRYIKCASDESTLIVPEACFQCVGTAIEEPDLNYIMRLRRDYELATQG